MTEEKAVEEKTEEPKEPGNVEALATKLGWNPNYDGDEREFVSAEKYILRSREIQDTTSKQLKVQRREVEKLQQGLEALKAHNETVYKVQVANLKKELSSLKKQRKEADEDGDTSLVRELDNKINDIEKIPSEVKVPKSQSNPEFDKWLEKNDWYETDEEMRIYADIQGDPKINPDLAGLSHKKFYAAIRKRVKEKFPEYFGQATKEKPAAAAVEGSTPTKRAGKKFTMRDLSEDQKKYAKLFAEQGIMKTEDYIADLVKIGELK